MKKDLHIFLLIIVSVTVLLSGYDIFSNYKAERESRELRIQTMQAYLWESEIGREIADIYDEIFLCNSKEVEKYLMEERIPESIEYINLYYEKFDTLPYLMVRDIVNSLRDYEKMLSYLSNKGLIKYKDLFLTEFEQMNIWGIACKYYSNSVDYADYFSNQEVFNRKHEWYTAYNVYKENDWEEYRQKYDDLAIEEMRIAEQKDTAFYDAYNVWLLNREELNETGLENYLHSEETKELLKLCEESIAADIDSFVYWDENTEMKVYVLYNYAKYHEEFLGNFQ